MAMGIISFLLFTFVVALAVANPANKTDMRTIRNCDDFIVQRINELPEEYKKGLDTNYYKKWIMGEGIPIMGPGDIPDYTYKESARILQQLVWQLKPGFRDALVRKLVRVVFWVRSFCDIPEIAKPCEGGGGVVGLAWDKYAGVFANPGSYRCDGRGNAWTGRIMMHEIGHQINSVFENNRDVVPCLQNQFERAFENQKEKRLWGDVGRPEYFNLGGQAFFEANEEGSCKGGLCNRDDLMKRDPMLYSVIATVFKDPPTWTYRCAGACDGAP